MTNVCVLLRLVLCGIASSFVSANCYWPNGTDRNALLQNDVYQPCDSGDEVSMCCALNRPYPDRCRNDGLCFSTYDQNIWRDSCTDHSWESSSCLKLCDSGTGEYIEGQPVDLSGSDFTVTPCSDGSWCCGNGTLADKCCTDHKGLFIVNGKATHVSPSSSLNLASTTSSSATSSRTQKASTSALTSETSAVSSAKAPFTSQNAATSSSSTALSAVTPSDTAKSSSSNHTGAIVGGVVGGVAAIATAVGVTFFLVRSRMQPRHHPTEVPGSTMNDAKPWLSAHNEAQALHEAPGSGFYGGNELDGGPPMQELGGSTPYRELHGD